jgi:nucleoside-diphosphate-sugar epimerase
MILVTGASGFVGRALFLNLLRDGRDVRAAFRSSCTLPNIDNCYFDVIGNIDHSTNWTQALKDVDVVIHLAGRVQTKRNESFNELSQYYSVNVEGTLNLARQAAIAGVSRFIFLSSIKAAGQFNLLLSDKSDNSPANNFQEFESLHLENIDVSSCKDFYGLSKKIAEDGLWQISSQTGMQVVVVRPPAIYGPQVKGNFSRLIRLLNFKLPIPLGAVNNKRSYIGIDNLLDILIRCVDHPNAAGRTLYVSDGHDLSTPELLRLIAKSMGQPIRLFPFPVRLLRLVGRMIGCLCEVDRLVSSSQVDIVATSHLLNWAPSITVEEGVRRMFQN